jgi:hypothetical protein
MDLLPGLAVTTFTSTEIAKATAARRQPQAILSLCRGAPKKTVLAILTNGHTAVAFASTETRSLLFCRIDVEPHAQLRGQHFTTVV